MRRTQVGPGQGCGGSRADGGKALRLKDQAQVAGAAEGGIDRIAAGQDDPIKIVERCQGLVEVEEAGGRNDLDGRDDDGDRTLIDQARSESGGLSSGTGDQDATACKRRWHGCS